MLNCFNLARFNALMLNYFNISICESSSSIVVICVFSAYPSSVARLSESPGAIEELVENERNHRAI